MININTYTGPSFSVKNRVGRLFWNFTSAVFFRLSPLPFFAWRNFLLRVFGAEVGRGVHIYPKVKIWAPWNLVLKDQSSVGNNSILYSQDKIEIGVRGIISQGTHLCTGTHDYTKTGHPLVTAPIIIKDHTWIAAETFVHPGITIGEGCVIGARSVVTKDMPDWMVCTGHPCKPIKSRVIVDTLFIKN